MRRYYRSNLLARKPLIILAVLLLTATPLFAAELSVQYEVIARSGETPVPGGVGNFTGFGSPPAIDDEGNVVFLSGGQQEVGIYTYTNGV